MESLCTCKCSKQDKQLVLYFALVLECNVSVLDSLFYASFAFLAFSNDKQKETFALQLEHQVTNRISNCIGPQNEPNHWDGPFGRLDWIVDVNADTDACNWVLSLWYCRPPRATILISFYVSNRSVYVSHDAAPINGFKLKPGALEGVCRHHC